MHLYRWEKIDVGNYQDLKGLGALTLQYRAELFNAGLR